MTVAEVREFVEAMCQRDIAEFDFDKMVDLAKERNPSAMPELIEILTGMVKAIGPAIFEAGYYAGCATAMEISRDLSRRARKEAI